MNRRTGAYAWLVFLFIYNYLLYPDLAKRPLTGGRFFEEQARHVVLLGFPAMMFARSGTIPTCIFSPAESILVDAFRVSAVF